MTVAPAAPLFVLVVAPPGVYAGRRVPGDWEVYAGNAESPWYSFQGAHVAPEQPLGLVRVASVGVAGV